MRGERRLWLLALVAVMLVALAGCVPETTKPAPKPEDPLIKGVKGQALWVGMMYNGFTTTSGEIFDMRKLTAAHATLPYGTKLEVINPANGKSVVVVVNDRRNLTGGAVLAISKAAADRIGLGGPKRRFTVIFRYAK